MILPLLEIKQILLRFNYLFLFPAVVVEGPIITVLAGFLTSLGSFNLFLVFATVVAGDLAGDWIHYAVGRWGRERFIERWGKYIGITNERVSRLEKHFEKHRIKTLLAGKISHGIGGAVLVAAGLANVPLREFLLINFLVTLPKSLALLLVGYYFGQAYAIINSYLEMWGFISLGVIVLAGMIYFFYYSKKSNG